MSLLDELQRAWDYVSSIEPALGKVSRDELRRVEGSIQQVEQFTGELEELEEDDAISAEAALAVLYARGAAIAIAAGDEVVAHRWFDEGQHYAHDESYAAQFDAGRRDPERFRMLVQGRQLIANNREREARALWRDVVKKKPDDALAAAATAEQKAPRPLKDGQMPSLWTYNGIGVGFSGSRDRWEDGSYVTTHCFKIIYIPIFPIRAYRVVDGGEEDSYIILAREQLSTFAKAWRWILAAMIVGGIAWGVISSKLNDPTRLAKQRWDDTIESVSKKTPDQAIASLDAILGDEMWRVGSARAQKVGAEIVRLNAEKVAKPFTREHVDHAARVLRRWEALPPEAKGGAARQTMYAALDKWTNELADTPENAEARLEMLRYTEKAADAKQSGPLLAKIEAMRIAAADAKAESQPLEALAIYVDKPSADSLAKATKIIERLVESPAILVDASKEVQTWMANTSPSNPLREKAQAALDAAGLAKVDALAEGVPAKKLEAMLKKQPWNQWAALGLANIDINAGKLEAAAARLRAFGKPAVLVRDVRQTLGQLESALGNLEAADELLSGMLTGRLARFQKIATEYDEATKKLQENLMARLRLGDVPYTMQVELNKATDEQAREIMIKWMTEQMEADENIKTKRDQLLAMDDVVPTALAAGGVKLRRAQGMSGKARDAMLGEAERMFLAIRTEAEGQPEFRIGLGEIYARLGKTKESEEQFAAVLEMKDNALSLRVARVYRGIGSTERAKAVATEVFGAATDDMKSQAAILLGIMSNGAGEEEQAEKWFRQADQKDPMVKTSLLEIEARRLLIAGKYDECAAKYAQIAKQHLAGANAMDLAAYNNAALAHQARFQCSADPKALVDAETTLEKAYRVRADEPIVVANLSELHDDNGRRRVLAKRIDMRVLRATSGETESVLAHLLASDERDSVLADLNADAGIRRSAELFKQYEVLAPNSISAYEKVTKYATERRDEAALAAILERVKNAKGIDTTEGARNRERFEKGELDQQIADHAKGSLEHLDALIAKPKLDAKTRAAALLSAGSLRMRAALYANNPAELATARQHLEQAAKLWPALSSPSSVVSTLIDEAGLEADANAWIAARRVRSAQAALDKLVADKSPLAAKIRASKQWADVRAAAASDTGRPGVDDLRIARLLGDATIEAHAKAVLDDKLTRLSIQIGLVLDPTSPTLSEDLALLDKR